MGNGNPPKYNPLNPYGDDARKANADKDPKTGKFVKGNKAQSVHSNVQAKSRQLTAALRNSFTPEDIAKIARVLYRKAMRGDVRAAITIFDRVMGKPVHATEITALNDYDDTDVARMTEQELVDIINGKLTPSEN